MSLSAGQILSSVCRKLILAIKEPSRIPYFLKGHFYAIVRRLYKAHFKDDDKLEEMFMIAAECPKCTLQGYRDCCSCEAFESIVALKHTCKYDNKRET